MFFVAQVRAQSDERRPFRVQSRSGCETKRQGHRRARALHGEITSSVAERSTSETVNGNRPPSIDFEAPPVHVLGRITPGTHPRRLKLRDHIQIHGLEFFARVPPIVRHDRGGSRGVT
jgi:hypothetical protein